MYLVVICTESASASAILQTVKGSMTLTKDGKFYCILGKIGDKDVKFDGNFVTAQSISVMSKDSLIP